MVESPGGVTQVPWKEAQAMLWSLPKLWCSPPFIWENISEAKAPSIGCFLVVCLAAPTRVPKPRLRTSALKSPQQTQGVLSSPSIGWEMEGSQQPGLWYTLNKRKGTLEEWTSTWIIWPESFEVSARIITARGSLTATARPPLLLPKDWTKMTFHPSCRATHIWVAKSSWGTSMLSLTFSVTGGVFPFTLASKTKSFFSMVPEFTKKLHQPFKQIRFTVSPTSSTSSTRAILRGLSFGPSKALTYSNLDTTSKTTRPTKPTPSQTHTTSKAARDETAMDRVPTRTHRPSHPPPTQPAGHPSPSQDKGDKEEADVQGASTGQETGDPKDSFDSTNDTRKCLNFNGKCLLGQHSACQHDCTLPRLQFHARIQFYQWHASASATSAQAQSAAAAATALTWLCHWGTAFFKVLSHESWAKMADR